MFFLRALQYASIFTCLIMASIWYKILSAINNVNLVIEARDSTIDVEVENIDGLTSHLVSLRDRWEDIYREASIVAENLGIERYG